MVAGSNRGNSPSHHGGSDRHPSGWLPAVGGISIIGPMPSLAPFYQQRSGEVVAFQFLQGVLDSMDGRFQVGEHHVLERADSPLGSSKRRHQPGKIAFRQRERDQGLKQVLQ